MGTAGRAAPTPKDRDRTFYIRITDVMPHKRFNNLSINQPSIILTFLSSTSLLISLLPRLPFFLENLPRSPTTERLLYARVHPLDSLALNPRSNPTQNTMAVPSPLIRLLPHSINSLPIHPSLASTISAQNNGEAAQNPDRLLNFARSLLAEAINFTDSYLPQEFKAKGTRSSAPATAKVELLEHIRMQKGSEETWFARRSRHVNKCAAGTADFAEFDMGLRQDHSVREKDYTPDVYDVHEVLSWDSDMAQAAEQTGSNGFPPLADISMRIYEMCHTLPIPLQPRVFAVLVAHAKTGPDSFVVAQIPVDVKSVPAAFYSNGRNIKEGTSPEKRKETVIGIYTSIERCKVLENGEVEWVMATASDARGALPMWMQKLGTPGAVLKDVGLFVKWIEGQRKVKK